MSYNYISASISISDYYPFGMLMPNRHGSPADGYRYGFNGMEKDDEVRGTKGASYDFGARMLDPRIGRWLSTDALEMKYVGLSPYNFVANNPLNYVDPDGHKIKGVKIKDGKYVYSKAALKRGTDKYIQARIKTAQGKASIDALIAAKGKKYIITVTDKPLVVPAEEEGKYVLLPAISDYRTRSIIVSTNTDDINTITDEQLKDAVTYTSNGWADAVDETITTDDLVNNRTSDNPEYVIYEKARNDAGVTDAFEKANPLKTVEQRIHALGAHEEVHLTEKNRKFQNKEDTYNTEKQAFEAEKRERLEYIKQNPAKESKTEQKP